jgi:hypothetical protein
MLKQEQVRRAFDENILLGDKEICTKPLARRTLPRVRGSAVGEGLK